MVKKVRVQIREEKATAAAAPEPGDSSDEDSDVPEGTSLRAAVLTLYGKRKRIYAPQVESAS